MTTKSATTGTPGDSLPTTGDPFIDSVRDAAIASQRETGVPASVTIAQALIESGRGKSKLTVLAHNYFGIKGNGPAGHVTMRTREVFHGHTVFIHAPFRAYHNAAESFIDHGKFFIQNQRYHKAMMVADDAHQFAVEIQKAGYATDPNYAKTINSVIDKFNLTRFDDIARKP
jgi:flagellum-specific peptidoglycan hydrolase FlgJ